MPVANTVSKLGSLDKSDTIRVTTTDGQEVVGPIETLNINLDEERVRDRDAYVDVLGDEDVAIELGSVWCQVTLSATRLRGGWTDLEAYVTTEVDENGLTEDEESLGVVETVERID